MGSIPKELQVLNRPSSSKIDTIHSISGTAEIQQIIPIQLDLQNQPQKSVQLTI